MTIKREEEIKCPACSASNTVLIWDTLNVSLDPDAKNDLLSGRINAFICTSCGKNITIDKEFLYHDMNYNYMAWYFPPGCIKDIKFLQRFKEDGEMELFRDLPSGIHFGNAYAFHYVFSMDELIRYILFRDSLGRIWENRASGGR